MAYPTDKSPDLGAVPVRRFWIPPGDAGTFTTLAAMRDAVNRGLTQPIVLGVVQRIARTIEARDPVQVWRAIRSWLLARFQFVPDPLDVETLRTPVEQLRQIAATGVMGGDCDDAAILAATLAKAFGLRVRFVVLGFFSPRDPYRHVYAEVRSPDGWLDFDITRGGGVHPTPVRAATVEV